MDRDYYMAWWVDGRNLPAIKMYEISSGVFQWNWWYAGKESSLNGKLMGTLESVQKELLAKFKAPDGVEFFLTNGYIEELGT